MSYISSLKTSVFFAFALVATICCDSVALKAQFAPESAQNFGTVDPLLDDYRFFQPKNSNSLKTVPANEVAVNQRASSPEAGELDASLNVNIDSYPGNVRATAVQPDGKILVAGYFRTVNGIRHKSIVRLNADFSLDSTFSADINATILAVALQADGKIVIGGAFTTVGGVNRNRIARLNANGSLDTTFNSGTGADNVVYDVAVQADGKILLGGNFYGVNSTSNYGIARLNPNGSVDTSFVSPLPVPVPNPNPPLLAPSVVYSIAVQPDGKIVIGGFLVLSYAGSGLVMTPVMRLNANGTFDSSFNQVSGNSSALKIALQPDGKILMAGNFTTVNGINRNYIARLNADGTLDGSFNIGSGPNSQVLTLFIQPDGKILIAGLFNSINGTTRNRIARLNADGSLDDAFVPSGNFFAGTIQSLLSLPNGKILAGGSFLAGFNATNDSVRIFNQDGSADTSFRFDTTALGGVRAVAVQPDGKILVGGNFTRPRSGGVSQLFRLNVNGSIDETFAPSSSSFSTTASGQVNSIVIQPDGKILIAGFNIAIGGGGGLMQLTHLARLNPDGTPDASFTPGTIPASRGINTLALQPDGKIIIVWGTTQIGLPSGGIARLNADGSIDASFSNNFTSLSFDSVVVQPDGKILVGGPFSFSYVNSQTGTVSFNGIVRLNADGSHDASFVPATVSSFENGRVTQIYSLALQSNGKVLIGGSIYTNGATTPTGVVRLNADGTLDTAFNSGAISGASDAARVEDIFPLANGKILIGGLFNNIGVNARNNIARLNADGSVDNSFNANTDNAVYEIATQADGRVLIGGDFETVNGVLRTSLARLLSEPTVRRTPFDFDGDGKADVSVFRPENGLWYLLNSQAGLTGISFGQSTDKLAPADYDGDGKTDIAVFRSGTWYLQRSTQGFTGIAFGAASDVPVPADFDGDGKSELAVFRPSSGTWYVYNLATNQTNALQFGAAEDKPVVGDYDGDGRADYAVFRPSTGIWYLQRSTQGFTGFAFGQTEDKPVPADYDGDAKTDIVVFRPSTGTWYLNRSSQGFTGISFGIGTDAAVPADYDGDGRADVAVYRNGIWYLNKSTTGFTGVSFGAAGDKPIPNSFIP